MASTLWTDLEVHELLAIRGEEEINGKFQERDTVIHKNISEPL